MSQWRNNVETQAPYVVIPGVTGPSYTEATRTTTGNIHWSFLPEVHGEVAVTEVPDNRVLGVDVSRWNAHIDPPPVIHMDWEKCSQAGAKFAFIRAGSINAVSGVCYTDFEFDYNSEVAHQLMPVGYYWYYRPNFDSLLQSDFFCGLIEGKDWRLPPVVDVETMGGLGASQVASRLVNFCYSVYDNLGQYPMIYTRGTFWNPNGPVPGVGDNSLWASLDLWVARYTVLPEPWGNPGDQEVLRPRHWNDWLFWQFSDGGNGRGAEFGAQSASIDINLYNGNQDDFEDEFGLGLTLEEKVDRLWNAHPELWDQP